MAKQFGQSTPPAVFPVILGTLGLGMVWRNAAIFATPAGAIGDLILAIGVALFAVGFVAYLVKLVRRPGCLTEDMRTVPGRTGLSAMSMSMMLVAGALWPIWPGLAKIILFASLGVHLVVVIAMVIVLLPLPFQARQMTPAWHLAFVGLIVGAMVMIPMGYLALASVIFVISLMAAATIWLGTMYMYMKSGWPPAPLRPLLAINLGPSALLGMVAIGLGFKGLAVAFLIISVLIFVLLALRFLWLVEAGFSPFWGAFTFPLAAFTSQLVITWIWVPMPIIVVFAAMLVSTLAIPPIVVRVVQMWIKGTLAAKSNAARA